MCSGLSATQCILAGAVVFLLSSFLTLVAPSEPNNHFAFDFVVIGWISEGSIIAKRLSENPNWNVLVLVPGNYTDSFETLHVEKANKTLAHQLRWPRLGHERSPEHYVRGVPQDYDHWAQEGNSGWSWNDVLPYFEKSVAEAESVYTRMMDSYVVLNKSETINQDLVEVEKMVLSASSRFKSRRVHHTAETGFCDLPYTEVRQTPSLPNYHVIKKAGSIRINFDASGKRVESVDFVIVDQNLTVDVRKELVLSAGAIESAKLLMLSGIGNKEHLESLNIPVLHDLPVGRNLKDQITLPLFFTTPVPEDLLEDTSTNFTEEIEQRHGPFGIQGMLPLTEFVNTIPGNKSRVPDIELHYLFIKHHDLATLRNNWKGIGSLNLWFFRSLQRQLRITNLIIVQAVLVHPKSTGRVELRTDDFMYRPKILPNYLENPEDVETLLRSIYYVKNKLKTPSFKAYQAKLLTLFNPECYTKPHQDDFYWHCYMKYMTMPKLNPVGTVKMGPSKNESCVNSRLLVHGVENLRVADAGIMPDIPSSEITAATMMIAEKAADLIKEDWM